MKYNFCHHDEPKKFGMTRKISFNIYLCAIKVPTFTNWNKQIHGNMSSFILKNDIRNNSKENTKVYVNEIYETFRITLALICFLLVIFLISWIVYVIWKTYCRRSAVVDQSQNQEYIEMQWEHKARDLIVDSTSDFCITSFILDVFYPYHLTHFEGTCNQGEDIGNSTTLDWMKVYFWAFILKL